MNITLEEFKKIQESWMDEYEVREPIKSYFDESENFYHVCWLFYWVSCFDVEALIRLSDKVFGVYGIESIMHEGDPALCLKISILKDLIKE